MKIQRRGKRITAARVRDILASQTFTVDTELKDRLSSQPLLLEDGQLLLVFEDGAGTIYPSRKALVDLMDHVESLAKQGPVDPKRSLLPTTAAFLANIKSHAAQLAKLLELHDPLDGSESSLKLVDRAVHALPKDERMSSGLVTCLVAYVGEIMRSATGGYWSQIGSAPDDVEPVVIGRDGRVWQPFAVVYLELLRGRRGSLHGATSAVLHR